MSLYYPVNLIRVPEKPENPHKRNSDGKLIVPPEVQFRNSHANALKRFLDERDKEAQPDLPPVQQEGDCESLDQETHVHQHDLDEDIVDSDIGYTDEELWAQIETDDEVDPPTQSVDESQSDVEDEDEDLEFESDIVTFENAAFVFFEALKRKLMERMDKFESFTLELFHLFIKYRISSLTQANANDHAKTVMGENPLKAVEVLRQIYNCKLHENCQGSRERTFFR